MLLAINVGNTHTVVGLYRDEVMIGNWRLESDRSRTVDEFALQLVALLGHVPCKPSEISEVIISCVVPPLTRVFGKLSQKYFHIEPLVVNPQMDLGIKIGTDNPSGTGADRIVNAVACRKLFGAPAIIIDFGTATTFDVLDADEVFAGGAIAPGLVISAEALFDRAAMLHSIELKTPTAVIGTNTHDAMLSGILFGYAGLVDGMIERIKAAMMGTPIVIATGGLARLIADQSRAIERVVPDLTLEGLRIIASFNGSAERHHARD